MSGQRPAKLCTGVLLTALWSAGCTSYSTVLDEFDSLSTLAARAAQTQRPQDPFILFESIGAAANQDNANRFARERMLTLVDTARGDRQRSTEVIWRLLWVAQLDRSPLNKIRALEGMSQLMEGLELAMVVQDLGDPPSPADSDFVLTTLSQLVAAARQGTLEDAGRQELIDLLDFFRQNPLPTPPQRRRLVAELAPDRFTDLDAELRRAQSETLDRALEHAVYIMFMLHLRNDQPAGIEVRRAAIQEFHRRAGPDSVALLLRITRRPRDTVPAGQLGFDPSPYVLLELVRLCGQLNRERALVSNGNGPAPAEFLYQVVRAPLPLRGPERGLWFLAMEALALSLEMPVSFDQKWADDWFAGWNAARLRGGPDR